ncbi:hypothetical protein MIND_01119100 [Mycena indigotica]|uniref:Uncharacterized protein n=1 Tax=Mycena indigotica TaxID=2126181 RepID=A0A8H6S5U4_9AGAR|nr:uncharacterized protein MIND_01119100 [Mycena indigotica]KAF7293419.1 hypothetical protein MIND_01119100 [Mycena indigotica]
MRWPTESFSKGLTPLRPAVLETSRVLVASLLKGKLSSWGLNRGAGDRRLAAGADAVDDMGEETQRLEEGPSRMAPALVFTTLFRHAAFSSILILPPPRYTKAISLYRNPISISSKRHKDAGGNNFPISRPYPCPALRHTRRIVSVPSFGTVPAGAKRMVTMAARGKGGQERVRWMYSVLGGRLVVLGVGISRANRALKALFRLGRAPFPHYGWLCPIYMRHSPLTSNSRLETVLSDEQNSCIQTLQDSDGHDFQPEPKQVIASPPTCALASSFSLDACTILAGTEAGLATPRANDSKLSGRTTACIPGTSPLPLGPQYQECRAQDADRGGEERRSHVGPILSFLLLFRDDDDGTDFVFLAPYRAARNCTARAADCSDGAALDDGDRVWRYRRMGVAVRILAGRVKLAAYLLPDTF